MKQEKKNADEEDISIVVIINNIRYMTFFYNGYVYCATLIYDNPYYGSRRKWRVTFDSEVEISDAEKIIVENMNDDKKPSKKEYDKNDTAAKVMAFDKIKAIVGELEH